MAFQQKRESLADEISRLQQQQLTANQDAKLSGLTPEALLRAFDTRFARIASLMHQLADLDELESHLSM